MIKSLFWHTCRQYWLALLLLGTGPAAMAQSPDFGWDSLPAHIRNGQEFTVKLVNFGSTANLPYLSAVFSRPSSPLVISELNFSGDLEFANAGRLPLDLTGWRVLMYDSVSNAAPRITFAFPAGSGCPPGQVFRLQFRANVPEPGTFPLFICSAPFPGRVEQRATVVLLDPRGSAADVLPVGLDLGSIRQPVSNLTNLWKGPALTSFFNLTRVGALNHFGQADWITGDPTPGTLNKNMILPFDDATVTVPIRSEAVILVGGYWTGPVLLDTDFEPTEVRLRADTYAGTGSSDSAVIPVWPRYPLALALPAATTENEGGLIPATVSLPEALAHDVVITLASSAPEAISVGPSVTLAAGTTNAAFNLVSHEDHLLGGSRTVVISATAPGLQGTAASIEEQDRQSATLALQVSAELTEGGLPGTGSISTPVPPGKDVQIQITAEPAGRLIVPPSVWLRAGETNASFPILANDDVLLNGDRTVVVRASVPNWVDSTTSLVVHDNETATIQMAVAGPLLEGTGAMVGRLTLGGAAAADLAVTLVATPAGQVAFPTNPIVIPRGELTAGFVVSALDNAVQDGSRDVQIKASVAGYPDAAASLTIRDDEPDSFLITGFPLTLAAGQQIPVVVSAIDDQGLVLTQAGNTFSLAADAGSVTASSPLRLTNGVWSGTVSFSGAAGRNHLQATIPGASGASAPFVVDDSGRFVPFGIPNPSPAPEMVSSPAWDRIYLLFPTNGLLSLDPLSGALSSLRGTPGGRQLVQTDSGEFLYWLSDGTSGPQVTRFETASGHWTNFSLQAPAATLQIVPHSPRRYVAATAMVLPGNVLNYGIFEFEDGLVLPKNAGSGPWGQSYSALTFTADDTLYGYEGQVTSYRFVRHQVDDGGVTFLDVPSATDGIGADDVPTRMGLVYGNTGIFDPATGIWQARFPVTGRPWLHAPTHQVVILQKEGQETRLRGFDWDTARATGSSPLPPDVNATADLAFWGTDGVAVSGNGGLWLLNSPCLQTNALADLAIAFDRVTPDSRTGQTNEFELVVSNPGSVVATNILVRYPVPAGVQIPGILPDTAERAGGSLSWTFPSLSPLESLRIRVAWSTGADGSVTHTAQVSSASPEGNLLNNSARREILSSDGLGILTVIPVRSGDIVWDEQRSRLYASVNDDADPLNGWIASINLEDYSVTGLARVGELPGRLVLSDDASMLYVATDGGTRVARIRLDNGTVDLTFGVPGISPPIRDMAVLPGRPGAVAISGSVNTALVYEDGVALPGPLPGPLLRPGAEAGELYTFDQVVPATMTRFNAISRAGDDVASTGVLFQESDFAVEHGFLCTATGFLLDAGSLRLLGTFPNLAATDPVFGQSPRQYQRVATDLRHDRAYYFQPLADPQLQVYSVNDLTQVGGVRLTNFITTPEKMVVCNPGKLAFRESARGILVMRTPFPNTNAPVDLGLVHQPPATPTTLGAPLTFVISVTNNSPAAAQEVILRDALPDVDILQASSTQGTWQLTNGVVVVSAGTVPPGASFSLTLLALPRSNGKMVNSAVVLAANPDDRLANNSASASPTGRLSRVLPLPANDMSFDGTAGRLLATVGPTGGADSNSVVTIDPATGMTGTLVRLGAEPGAICVSPAGDFLYVGLVNSNKVLRVNLASGLVDLEIPLTGFPIRRSSEISLAVPAGSPETLLISSREGVMVYDRDQPRPTTVSPGSYNYSFALGDDGFFQVAEGGVRRLKLAADGVSVAVQLPLPAFEGVYAQGDRLLTVSGYLLEAKTGSVLGLFSQPAVTFGQFSIPGPFLPDLANGQVLSLTSPQQPFFYAGATLTAFSTNDYSVAWSATVPEVTMFPARFVRAGPDYVAFVAYCSHPGYTCGGSQVGIVHVGGISRTPAADLQLSVTAPPQVVLGSPFTVTENFVNRGPWMAKDNEVEVTVPTGLTYLSGSSSVGSVAQSGNTLRVHADRLAPGEGGTISLTFQAVGLESPRLQSVIRSATTELAPENNTNSLALTVLPLPRVDVLDFTLTEGQNLRPVVLPLSAPLPVPVTVVLEPRSGTAIAPQDFDATPLTVQIPAGAVSGTVSIRVVNDTAVEGPETLFLKIASATNAFIGRGEAMGTILDNDQYRLSITTATSSVLEGNSSFTNVIAKVTLTPASPVPVTVDYSTGGGTATPGTGFGSGIDYLALKGHLVFAPGVTNLPLTVSVLGDFTPEPEETFALVLENPQNASLQNGAATFLIRNDDVDTAPAVLGLTRIGQSLTVRFTSTPTFRYQVQFRENLASDGWLSIGAEYFATDGVSEISFDYPPPGTSPDAGYFRVLGTP